MASTGYQNRRYKVVDGRLRKSWTNPPPPGWFVEKADAWADHAEKIAEAKTFDEALAAKKALRATQTPPEPDPEPAASEMPPVNGGDPDTAPEVEEPETETPEPEVNEESPETEPTAETPEPEIAAPEPTAEPTPAPAAPQRVFRMAQLIERTGHSRTTIQRQIEAGTFPGPDLDLGNNQPGWFEATIEALPNEMPGEPEPEAA